MTPFDDTPVQPELGDGIFGLQAPADARIRLLPVPFEATTSYGRGTAQGPAAIHAASEQLDLHDRVFGDIWTAGITLEDPPALNPIDRTDHAAVDRAAETVAGRTRAFVESSLAHDHVPGVIGGEHAIALGGILGASQAVSREGRTLGVLQIDAHHDLRNGYEGYQHSHASVMFNALNRDEDLRVIAVGIRDYAAEEARAAASFGDRVKTFYDADLASRAAEGKPWSTACAEIVSALPDDVWITFDIDGLDPSLCPGTGTPVPGGLSFREASVLLRAVATSGKRIVGFDLVEVAPSEGDAEWNANVGARVLYQLCGAAAANRGWLTVRA